MAETLEQLIQNRIDLIEAHRKNDFTDGIHALLTDLYPDTAHFIYELLQNAEDMNATVVRFVLDENFIDFEHNGTKRSFNLSDIDAITNIGHNGQKKDDPTSIGKFGVGFKAVFAYTATPIIHSGEYHFKIRDYFVPELQGVEKVSTMDRDGVSWTKFSFPFNNPKKPPAAAFQECLDGLMALDSSAVLFLQNIRKIEYMLPSGECGYVARTNEEAHRVVIVCKRPGAQETATHWMRFHKSTDIMDDHGKLKTLPIAVAFALETDERGQKERIVPVQGGGRTFIYFPAEKEYSGLRFHINAPFASTVARDSVRNCAENVKLIRAISELIDESLPEIKAQGLMNHSFFEVLPSNRDHLSIFYQSIFDYIYAAFQKNAYLPTRNGGYASAQNALTGPAFISNILQEEELLALFHIQKTWILNAVRKDSNADHFIQSLDIQTFTFKDFAQIFAPAVRSKTERLLKERQNDWLKRFYALCAAANEELDDSTGRIFQQNMKQTLAIRSSKGEMYQSSDVYILPVNATLMTRETPIVDSTFVHPAEKTDKICDKIRDFFQKDLKIKTYGENTEIEELLHRYDHGIEPDDQYFRDLLTFAKYRSVYTDIEFSQSCIFLGMFLGQGKPSPARAPELFLGEAYGNDAGESLAYACDKGVLWVGYAKHYNEKELRQFLDFASHCHICKRLLIEEQSACKHPLYHSVLCAPGQRNTGRGVDVDYTIPGLEQLLKGCTDKISKAIWETLERYGKGGSYQYTTARYAPNSIATPGVCDSTLIYYLKEYAWLPHKLGGLCKPGDLRVADLHPDFPYDPSNKLMAALKIGSTFEKMNREKEKLERDAKRAGFRLVTEEQFAEYLQMKAKQERTQNVTPLSGQDLLVKQQKPSAAKGYGADDTSADGAVIPARLRETNIEATFRNAKEMKPAQRQLFGRVVESTKEERELLRHWYHGKCQMCGTRIMGHNKVPYFVAKNVISTRHLSAPVRQTTGLAWNSLCLCPNCAAKYDVCSRDLNGLYDQIMQNEVIEGDAEPIVLTIELDGKTQEIRYIPQHFLALKKALQLIDCETME